MKFVAYSFCIVLVIFLKVKVKLLSGIRLLETPWAVALYAPLSVGFPKQEFWSGLPYPFPGDLPNLGIEVASVALQEDSL